MDRKWALTGIIAALACLFVGAVSRYCTTRADAGPLPAGPVRIGTADIEMSALIYIAEEQGYFTRKGISASLPQGEISVDRTAGTRYTITFPDPGGKG